MTPIVKKAQMGILAGLLAAGVAGTAHADAGFMLGGGLYYGFVNEDVDGDFDVGDIKIDDSSAAYNLDVGYRINNWIAVDAGYWDLGSYSSDSLPNGEKLKSDASAWSLGGIASLPIWLIDIYARGGYAWWDTNNKNSEDNDGADLYYGVGLAFNLGRSIDIYGEWVRFDLDGTDLDQLGVGVRFTF
jgi:hypothetical protein